MCVAFADLDSAPAAVLTGTVTWTSPIPAEIAFVGRDAHVCGRAGPVREAGPSFDGRGRVREAVVFIEGARVAGSSSRVWKAARRREVIFDQRNCTYVPAVAASVLGAPVRFTSSDPILHNVHVTDESGATIANYAMPVMGQSFVIKPSRTGVLSVRCDAGHTWMRASLVVLPHPFFSMTDGVGRFEIRDVPPGQLRLVAWHPDLGRIEKAVTVPNRQAAIQVDVRFESRGRPAEGREGHGQP